MIIKRRLLAVCLTFFTLNSFANIKAPFCPHDWEISAYTLSDGYYGDLDLRFEVQKEKIEDQRFFDTTKQAIFSQSRLQLVNSKPAMTLVLTDEKGKKVAVGQVVESVGRPRTRNTVSGQVQLPPVVCHRIKLFNNVKLSEVSKTDAVFGVAFIIPFVGLETTSYLRINVEGSAFSEDITLDSLAGK